MLLHHAVLDGTEKPPSPGVGPSEPASGLEFFLESASVSSCNRRKDLLECRFDPRSMLPPVPHVPRRRKCGATDGRREACVLQILFRGGRFLQQQKIPFFFLRKRHSLLGGSPPPPSFREWGGEESQFIPFLVILPSEVAYWRRAILVPPF